jgi:hypothetical protein
MSREGHAEPVIEVPPGLLERVDDALQACALRRETTTYLALAEALAVPLPHHLRKVMVALEQLASRDHAAGRPILAALVVSRARAPIPAPGFFAHLVSIGAYVGPEEGEVARRWHERELLRVFEHLATG